MSSNFSFQRLAQLVQRQWYENARLYIFSTLALVGVMVLVMGFWIFSSGKHYNEDSIWILYLFGLFITGCIFASFSFHALSDKTRATYFLSIPASHLEKLLCVIFYSTVVFLVVYNACFFLAKTATVFYIESLVRENPALYSFKRLSLDDNFWTVFRIFIYGFFAVQSFYLLGAIYFSRYSFVITTITGAAIIIFFSFYNMGLAEGFFDSGFNWDGRHLRIYESDHLSYRRYELSPFIMDLLFFLIKFVWAPVFWTAAWFRLKEKQV